MRNKSSITVLLVLMSTWCWKVDSYTKDDLYNLSNYLFSNYNLQLRPTTNGEPTFVFVDVYLLAVEELNEKSQELETSIVIEAWWNDDYLTWNESAYGGITHILYTQEKVWLPDLVVENSVQRQRQMGYDDNKVDIVSSGNIFWKPSELVKTSCDIDVTYYPFDTQTCKIIISTWMSAKDQVIVDPDSGTKGMLLTRYSPSGTWDLVENTFTELEDDDENNLTRIQFTLKLKRLKTYYILNLILPLLFLSLTASMVFFLPAESGEKVGLSITVLLAYAVYLTVVSEDTPQTSLQVSFLEIYLTTLLGLTAVSVILTVIVLHIHNKPNELRIGHRTEAATRAIRRILWSQDQNMYHHNNSTNGDRPRSRSPSNGKVAPLEDILQPSPTPSSGVAHEDIHVEEEEITWSKVAETMDRVCFIVSASLVLIITVVFLLVIGLGDN